MGAVTFEEFVFAANGAESPAQLIELFAKVMDEKGYDKFLFALLTDHNDIQQRASVGVVQNYPVDWMEFYRHERFDRLDPIVTYGVHQHSAFAWDDIPVKVKLARKQRQILEMGKEAGLHNGVSIPLRGPKFELAGMSLASSHKKGLPPVDPDVLTAYCNHFYAVYKRLHANEPVEEVNIVLTPAEVDVLALAAAGKSDAIIAELRNCTPHAVNMSMRGIYRKLGVNNRTVAVVKAIAIGILR